MKTQLTVTVDVEVLISAKQRVGNMSAYVNDVLSALVSLPEKEIPEDLGEARDQITKNLAEIAELQKHIRKQEKDAKDKEDPIREVL